MSRMPWTSFVPMGLLLTACGCVRSRDAGGGAPEAPSGKGAVATECSSLRAKPSWGDVKNILRTHCVACHPGYAEHRNAQADAAAIISRTDLDPLDLKFMPKGRPKLGLDERTQLVIWLEEGAPNDEAPAEEEPDPEEPELGEPPPDLTPEGDLPPDDAPVSGWRDC